MDEIRDLDESKLSTAAYYKFNKFFFFLDRCMFYFFLGRKFRMRAVTKYADRIGQVNCKVSKEEKKTTGEKR